MVGRTSIMAIIGGTFAKLGGGKFANGAMSAAFTHLFNAEAIKFIKAKLPSPQSSSFGYAYGFPDTKLLLAPKL